MVLLQHGDLAAARAAIEDALAAHAQLREPFELARTHLAQGSIERRAKRKAESRMALGRAEAIFDGLGATLWLERTQRELARTGITRSLDQELTPTERRIAELAATGAQNKEIAGALFVSVKTVEANLSRVYAKLGIRSRVELASGLAKDAQHGSGRAAQRNSPPSPLGRNPLDQTRRARRSARWTRGDSSSRCRLTRRVSSTGSTRSSRVGLEALRSTLALETTSVIGSSTPRSVNPAKPSTEAVTHPRGSRAHARGREAGGSPLSKCRAGSMLPPESDNDLTRRREVRIHQPFDATPDWECRCSAGRSRRHLHPLALVMWLGPGSGVSVHDSSDARHHPLASILPLRAWSRVCARWPRAAAPLVRRARAGRRSGRRPGGPSSMPIARTCSIGAREAALIDNSMRVPPSCSMVTRPQLRGLVVERRAVGVGEAVLEHQPARRVDGHVATSRGACRPPGWS